ncbi:MAG: hypothetical protein KC466_03110 [Myxococcales bacterium]|nr:hypothetical protein [Myxococcales bacterium]
MSLELLDTPYRLATADRYADPANPAAALPIVYGALAASGGAAPTVEIDRARHLFLVADHDVEAIDAVYVDGVSQSSGFTKHPATDLDGLGIVAYVEFAMDPAGLVTVDARGREPAGSLLTDAVDVIEDFLRAFVGLPAEAFDATSWEIARRHSKARGLKLAGLVERTRTPREWLALWLFQILGDLLVTHDERLAIHLDGAPWPEGVFAPDLVERDTVEVAWTLERDGLVNRPVVDYRYNWSSREAEARSDGVVDAVSVNRFGREFVRAFELPWVREAAQVADFQARLLDRYAGPRWRMELRDASRAPIALKPGDRFTFTHGAAPHAERYRRVWRALGVTKELETGAARVVAEDTGGSAGLAYVHDGAWRHDAAITHGNNPA